MDNFYEILEVSPTASDAEIQHVYRQLIQVWHPDRYQGNPELLKRVEQKTKQLNEAFRHLSDPQLRAQHDESLNRLRADTVRSSEFSPGPSPSKQTEEVAVVTCPNPACEIGLRVPTEKRLKVVCPRCNTHFMYDSTLESAWNVHVPEGNEGSGGNQAEKHFTAVVNSALRKPIVWVIAIVALVIILNSWKPWEPVSIMTTASQQTSLPKESSVVVPPAEARTRDFRSSPVTPEKDLSLAPTSTAPLQTSLPKGKVFLVPSTQIQTQDPSSSSHVIPEAGRNLSQPIPRIERQPMSLSTGTRIERYRVPLPPGRGNLRIVNGTHLDAVVRLGEYAEHRRPLASLYVKAGQEVTIHDIGEGAYRLAFSLGIDWDQATKEFRKDKAFTMFDEPFNFEETTRVTEIETNDGPKTRSSVRFVKAVATLHAVPDGHAKTTLIDKETFDRLFEDRD